MKIPSSGDMGTECAPGTEWIRLAFEIGHQMARLGTAMVVDDDAGVREPLRLLLEEVGYEVRTAVNGLQALDLLNQGAIPELLLLDLMMQGMSGFELITALRANPVWDEIPVIVVTGTRGYSTRDLQVDAVLLKPFNVVDVRAAAFLARKAKRRNRE